MANNANVIESVADVAAPTKSFAVPGGCHRVSIKSAVAWYYCGQQTNVATTRKAVAAGVALEDIHCRGGQTILIAAQAGNLGLVEAVFERPVLEGSPGA